MQSAIDNGTRLNTYDKAFIYWMAVNLGSPDCGLLSSQEQRDLELFITETAIAITLSDALAGMQAQMDFGAYVPELMAKSNTCSNEHAENGRKLHDEIVLVLRADNTGSRVDFKEYLEDSGVLPEEEPIQPIQDSQTAPLYKSEIRPLGNYDIDMLCISGAKDGSKEVCDKLFKLMSSNKYQTIRCVYGPFRQDGTGYESYTYWFKEVPENLAAFAVAGKRHPFNHLGKVAINECPGNNHAAMQTREKSSF